MDPTYVSEDAPYVAVSLLVRYVTMSFIIKPAQDLQLLRLPLLDTRVCDD